MKANKPSLKIELSLRSKMKPVSNWNSVGRGYRFKEKTWYSPYHLGLDLMTPSWTPLYAPFDGYSSNGSFTQGGNVINFTCNGLVMRFMHLAKISKLGQVKEGEIIGYTGNSGTLTTGAHLHVDISRGTVQINNINNFIDPETFNWEGETMSSTEFDQLFASLQDRMKEVRDIWTWQGVADTKFTEISNKLNEISAMLNKLAEVNGIQDTKIAELKNIAPVSPVLSQDDQQALSLIKRLLGWLKSLIS